MGNEDVQVPPLPTSSIELTLDFYTVKYSNKFIFLELTLKKLIKLCHNSFEVCN